MIDINYCSQKGLCDTNQDFILCKQLQDGSCIAILADGMGGLQYGEIAAATVAQSIYKILAEHNSVDIRELLAKAFEQADIAVADKCKALCCKMGAAVTVLYIKDDTAYYAWQGNVRNILPSPHSPRYLPIMRLAMSSRRMLDTTPVFWRLMFIHSCSSK